MSYSFYYCVHAPILLSPVKFYHCFCPLHAVGCKIKALRAKTNTYVKTPVRGEEPIFIITGRPEDVSVAKKEILQAADHFSQIRAARRNNSVSSPSVGSTTPSSSEDKVTIFVRVPYRVVGLVVGPKGATVKRIQQTTGTFIVTPSRDMEPYFEVRGTPENVEQAKKEIESYIALRTGGSFDQLGGGGNGLVHSPSPATSEGGLNFSTTKRVVRRTMSVSETSNLLRPSSALPSTSTVSETVGGRVEHRSSPLSSAVFSSGSNFGLEDETRHSIPMSAPAFAFNKVFDFGGDKLKNTSTHWNGSWSPQPTTTTGSWMANIPPANSQPPSPSGSWGSGGGKLSPQPPSPTGSWGSNSSEGTAVTSPRGFPNSGFISPQGYSQFTRLSLMQQLRKTNQDAYTGIGLCCYCERSEVDTIMIPCGHKSTCLDCAYKISNVSSFCPACNTKIESLVQQVCS